MKILMVNKFLFPNGGSETYIFKIGDYLNSHGHSVEYFGMEHEGRKVGNSAGIYTREMDFHSGSAISKLGYPFKIINSREAREKIKIILRDFKPDVVHLNNFNFQLTPSVIQGVREYEKETGRRVGIVYTAHDYQLICPNHMLRDGSGNMCELCAKGNYKSCIQKKCIHGSAARSAIGAEEGRYWKKRGIYKYIDTIICPSEFMRQKLSLNPLLAPKCVMLHNFGGSFKPSGVQKQNYVLYFGRYDDQKGIKNIIEANNIDFVCAGSGKLEGEINSCSHITNVGFKTGDELAKLIEGAVCSVYPSTSYENCPFSVMESIQCGTPVVGANIGGIPELIKDGKTGLLFESGNTADMSKKIKQIRDNPVLSKQMSENCKKEKFDDIAAYCEKLLAVYGKTVHPE